MKTFIIKLFPYIVILLSVSLLGWIQKHYHAPEGDLIRTGFLRSLHQYENRVERTEKHEAKGTTFIFGDSFLVQDDSSTYSRYLDTPTQGFCWYQQRFSAHGGTIVPGASIFDLPFRLNPDSSKINNIIFETIERNISRHARAALKKSNPPKTINNTDSIKSKNANNWHQHYPNGLRTIASFLGVKSHFLKNNNCLITRSDSPLPLYDENKLLSHSKTQKLRESTDEIFHQLEQLKPILDSISQLHDAEYLLFIIPDKISVYEEFLPAGTIVKPSFLNDPRLNDFTWVVSPLSELKTGAEQGTMELFKYSDTHFGPAGASIAGKCLQDAMDSRGW